MLCSIKRLWLGSAEKGTCFSEPDCTWGCKKLPGEIQEILASLGTSDYQHRGASKVQEAIYN